MSKITNLADFLKENMQDCESILDDVLEKSSESFPAIIGNNLLDFPDLEDVQYEHINYAKQMFTGSCRFCGQLQMIEESLTVFDNQSADEHTTQHCDCVNGIAYRAQKDRERQRDENVSRIEFELGLMSDYCDSHGIKMPESAKERLKDLVEIVLDSEISSASIVFGNKMTAKVSMNNKSEIVLDFKYQDGRKRQV